MLLLRTSVVLCLCTLVVSGSFSQEKGGSPDRLRVRGGSRLPASAKLEKAGALLWERRQEILILKAPMEEEFDASAAKVAEIRGKLKLMVGALKDDEVILAGLKPKHPNHPSSWAKLGVDREEVRLLNGAYLSSIADLEKAIRELSSPNEVSNGKKTLRSIAENIKTIGLPEKLSKAWNANQPRYAALTVK